MKYIKTFERVSRKFKVGDYVVAENMPYKPEIRDFLNNNVGEVVRLKDFNNKIMFYTNFFVKYKNVNKEIEIWFPDNIKEFDRDALRLATKEEIENQKIKNTANKFNI